VYFRQNTLTAQRALRSARCASKIDQQRDLLLRGRDKLDGLIAQHLRDRIERLRHLRLFVIREQIRQMELESWLGKTGQRG